MNTNINFFSSQIQCIKSLIDERNCKYSQTLSNHTYFSTFFLFGRCLTAVRSQSLFESESDSGNDSSNSEASSILVIVLAPKDDGSDDAVSRMVVDVFGRCNGV